MAVAGRRGRDLLELTKPKIVLLELIVAATAAGVASRHGGDVGLAWWGLVGAGLVAASASAANQLLERRIDATMARTANRPCASGRLRWQGAALASAALLAAGIAVLAALVNATTLWLGVLSWVLYVVVYTPLKKRTTLNTAVGAVAGAIPALMGWSAAGAPLNLTAWAVAGVLFVWQFPHFMAIAWLYRREYRQAGFRMTPVADECGWRTAALALAGALAVLPLSLVPALGPISRTPIAYSLWSLGLGAGVFVLTLQFAARRDAASARALLRGTLLYLPLWLAGLTFASF